MPRSWFATSLIKKGLDSIGKAALLPLAGTFRNTRRDTLFVGITGSCGKTTARHLTEAILRSQFKGIASRGTNNRAAELIRSILLTNRRHAFCLHELGAFGPGTLNELLPVFRPDIGVILNVGADHLSAFGSLDAVAKEKGKLVAILPESGKAILNADDPRVSEMASRTRAQVITFGCGSDAHFRAKDLSSCWPERLSFSLHCQGRIYRVQTRLCGEHWASSLLAAFAVGAVLGVPIERAIRAIEAVEPFPGRMSPVDLGNGRVLIRDDWKAPSWSFSPAFDFLRKARTGRRIFLMGQVSDDRRKPKVLYRDLTRQALDVAEKVCLVGRWAHHGLRALENPGDNSVVAFSEVAEAARFLEHFLRPGDLLYVKASGLTDDSLGSLGSLLADKGSVFGPPGGPGSSCPESKNARPELV